MSKDIECSCGNIIPLERYELGYSYCTTCSDKITVKLEARMVYQHKTAGEIMIFKGTKENIRIANRANERRR